MLVTVFCAPRDGPETTFALDVSPDLELRDFVALCELESGIPAGEIEILYIEQPLKDPTRALGTYGLKDGDVVVLRQADRRPPPAQPTFPGLPRIDFSSIAVPGTSFSSSQRPATRQQPQQNPNPQQQQRSPPPPAPPTLRGSASSPQGLDDPALLQQMLLANPHELSLLKERNPPLAEALLSGDLERFTKVLSEQQQDRSRREQERIRLLTADPFDLEAQAKIEEDIRQHNVEENMTIAMEEAPESFGQVVMLYINCKVNGHPVKAFVDSGAQMTIMSQACAERCNIMRLVDRRWAGIAKGVGTQKIIGRVHLAQVQIEGDFLPCSFSILEDQPMDMLLGLDMLKRHQCSIDLKKSSLLIGTTGTETRFLPEAELPECARLAYGPEGREDVRPEEEMADRELAEALQRSVQESDIADGQTTSPDSPPFLTPRPLRQTAASTSSSSPSNPGHPRSLALDRSKSAPASMQQAPTPGRSFSQPGFQEVHSPSSPAQETAPTAPQAPLLSPTNPTLDPLLSPTNPTLDPLLSPTNPTLDPLLSPTNPTLDPLLSLTNPTLDPLLSPTNPTLDPLLSLTNPTLDPLLSPTNPTLDPLLSLTNTTLAPLLSPTNPTLDPLLSPTNPTLDPLLSPTNPTLGPLLSPTNPTLDPLLSPTNPTLDPLLSPTNPTLDPLLSPTNPTLDPLLSPTNPTLDPLLSPTNPTLDPLLSPTNPTLDPLLSPTNPTLDPLLSPTNPTLDPLLSPTNPTLAPPPTPSATDLWSTCTPSAAATGPSPPAGPEGWVPAATQTAASSDWTADVSPTQPMEEGEEEAEPCPSAPERRAAEAEGGAESPDRSRGAERDQPEGERGAGSDSSIPSLAAALRELHELLVSSSHAHSRDRSATRSPLQPSRPDADGLDDNLPAAERRDRGTLTAESPHPPPPPPPPSTAITAGAELSDAKANHDAEPARASPGCLVPGSSGREESLGREVKGQGQQRCSDVDRYQGLGETRKGGGSVPGSELSSPPQGDPEFREPPEGRQGRGVADGRASGAEPPDDTLGLQPEPESLAPEEDSGISTTSNPQVPQAASPVPLSSAPHAPAERFPHEHLQRIQAAGFSAREAADALEQAQGCVELALLALLARNITVPT